MYNVAVAYIGQTSDLKILIFFSVLCDSQQKSVIETMGLEGWSADKNLESKCQV